MMSPNGMPLGIGFIVFGSVLIFARKPLAVYTRDVLKSSKFGLLRKVNPKLFIWEGIVLIVTGLVVATLIGLLDSGA